MIKNTYVCVVYACKEYNRAVSSENTTRLISFSFAKIVVDVPMVRDSSACLYAP
jgi:hypothetical protein